MLVTNIYQLYRLPCIQNKNQYHQAIPGLSSNKGSEPDCSAGDEDGEPQISDQAQLLKQRVLRKIHKSREGYWSSPTPLSPASSSHRGEISVRFHNSSHSVHTVPPATAPPLNTLSLWRSCRRIQL